MLGAYTVFTTFLFELPAGPVPAPAAVLVYAIIGSFVVRLTAFSEEPASTIYLQIRDLGTNSTWESVDSTTTPAIGTELSMSDIEQNRILEWRVIQINSAGGVADGTHGIYRPKSTGTGTASDSCGTIYSPTKPTIFKPCNEKADPWRTS